VGSFFILIGILLLPFVLLAIPIDIEYRYDPQSSARARTGLTLRWAFIQFRAKSNKEAHRHRDKARHKARPKQRAPHKTAKADKKGAKVFLALLRSEGFIRRLLRLFYAILSITQIKQLKARFLLGLDDPADTGLVFGLLMPGLSFLYAVPRVDFAATPIFDRQVIETHLRMKIRLVPIRYLKALIQFIFSRETFHAAKAAYRAYQQ